MFPSRYSYFVNYDRVEPVFLPGESQVPQSLVGCRLWGRTDLAAAAEKQKYFASITWPKFLRINNCDVLIELGHSSEYYRLPGT